MSTLSLPFDKVVLASVFIKSPVSVRYCELVVLRKFIEMTTSM